MILLSSSFNSLIQLLGVLLIFIFVLIITYFTTRWIGGFQRQKLSGHSFQVLDTVRIGNNKFAQILKLGDTYLVIAVGKDEVTMLAKLTEDEIGLTEEDITAYQRVGESGMTGVGESFGDTLEKIRERFSKKQD